VEIGLSLSLTSNKGVGGWTPARLGASLLGWWDAERADKLALSGSSVTTWTDIVANYAMTQAVGAAKPVYSATSFNGRPGITFDGADDELTLPSQPFPSGAAPSEIWGLVDQLALGSDVSTRRVASYGGFASGNNDLRQLARSANVGVMNIAQTLCGNGAASIAAANTVVDFSGIHVARGTFSATDTAIRVDGGAATSAAVVPATSATRARIGAATPGFGFWNGRMNTVLITGPLSAEQAAELTTYLKARGGIS